MAKIKEKHTELRSWLDSLLTACQNSEASDEIAALEQQLNKYLDRYLHDLEAHKEDLGVSHFERGVELLRLELHGSIAVLFVRWLAGSSSLSKSSGGNRVRRRICYEDEIKQYDTQPHYDRIRAKEIAMGIVAEWLPKILANPSPPKRQGKPIDIIYILSAIGDAEGYRLQKQKGRLFYTDRPDSPLTDERR